MTGLDIEHYVIPEVFAANYGNEQLHDIRIAAGDLITFTRLERLPIILNGLVESVVRESRQESSKRIEDYQRRLESRADRQNWLAKIPNRFRAKR